MRLFRVWIDVQVPGKEASVETLELPDSYSDTQCDEACAACLETMISNELDTGWEEVSDE